MTTEEFESIPENETFRTVTTKYHNVLPNNPFLTFTCKKLVSTWIILYDFADSTVGYVSEHGDILKDKTEILLIFPCSEEIYSLYEK